MKGKIIPLKDNVNNTIKEVIKSLLEKGCFDAILVPNRVPSGESFTYLLINDQDFLESCTPLPPIMPIQGARALRNLTRRGKTSLKVLCVMRPCEIRAAIELSKLRQVELENISFMSIDCPGALVTKDYIDKPKDSDILYEEVLNQWTSEHLRPTCNTCVDFSYENTPSDIHIGIIGQQKNHILLSPISDKGNALLGKIDIQCSDEISSWQTKVKEILQKKTDQRNKSFSELQNKTAGAENLDNLFSDCINCHNCMRVCPICYCRQCFFESSDEVRIEAENYFIKAQNKGGVKFPANTILFHLGRISHMALSCVNCGACEDGCPMDVPVAQVFSYIGDTVQKMFDYIPGKDRNEPIPILTYKEDELHEYEDSKGQQ